MAIFNNALVRSFFIFLSFFLMYPSYISSQELMIFDFETKRKSKLNSFADIDSSKSAPSEKAEIVIIDMYDKIAAFNSSRFDNFAVSAPSDKMNLLIDRVAVEFGIDADFIKAVIAVESGFDPKAVSKAGAAGLMQLMPDTALALGVGDVFDPEQNIRAGVKYLSLQLERFSSLELALAAYNAGPEAVIKYGGIPPYRETREYVKLVTSMYYAGKY